MGKKSEAFKLLEELLGCTRGVTHLTNFSPKVQSDSWYLAGWCKIHDDNHTTAYALWNEGAELVEPKDARLLRQARKSKIWADISPAESPLSASPLVGGGARVLDNSHVRAFSLPPGSMDPAQKLFAPTQGSALVFTTCLPLLTKSECDNICHVVDAHISRNFSGVWPTVRKSSVPTTDIAVEDVPELVPWLRALLGSRIFPLLCVCFPRLADESLLTADRIRIHDAFIVRYDSHLGSTSLPLHHDTSAISVTLPLTQVGVDYEGGGLLINALKDSPCGGVLRANAGEATVFAGPLRHGGGSIVSGVRTVLVLFLYVQDFAYGGLLRKKEGEGGREEAPHSEERSQNFVFYKETAALAEALNIAEDSE